MPLTTEELEDMRDLLKEAYSCAASNFRGRRTWDDAHDSKREAAEQFAAAATALLLVDERLEQASRSAHIVTLGEKLPGKP